MPTYNTKGTNKNQGGGQGTTKRNGIVAIAVIAVLAIVLGVGYVIQSNRDSTGDEADAPNGNAAGEAGGAKVTANVDKYGIGVGNPDAPIKVEIFEDFLCPFCKQFEDESNDYLREAAADGKVFVVYRPIAILNEYSSRALNAFAVVQDTAGPEAALKFHDSLFENQPSETGSMPDDQWLIDLAVESGATKDQVESGIKSGEFEQWILNSSDDASKRGVTGTPSVFADGEQIGGNTIDEMAENVEDAVESAQ